MAGERNPESLRAEALISWEWQPYEDVLHRAMDVVMPGRALRQYDVQRGRSASKRTTAVRRRELTQPEKVRSGQRDLARAAMRKFFDSGRAERAVIDGVDSIRWAERRRMVDESGRCVMCHHPTGASEISPTPPTQKKLPRHDAVIVSMDDLRNRRAVDRVVG